MHRMDACLRFLLSCLVFKQSVLVIVNLHCWSVRDVFILRSIYAHCSILKRRMQLFSAGCQLCLVIIDLGKLMGNDV